MSIQIEQENLNRAKSLLHSNLPICDLSQPIIINLSPSTQKKQVAGQPVHHIFHLSLPKSFLDVILSFGALTTGEMLSLKQIKRVLGIAINGGKKKKIVSV